MPADPIKIADVVVQPLSDIPKRIALLLWGLAGVGKTTLAATMPGKKLWLNFDPSGMESIKHFPDIIAADYTSSPLSVVERFKTENPGRIEDVLKANEDIETIVVDSITSFGDMALEHGVPHAARTAQHRLATLEDPGYGGCGRKLTWTMMMMKNIQRSATRFGCHTCFIAHESTPDKDKEGNIQQTTIHMSSTALIEVPPKLSEIWYMYDTGKQRKIAVRPIRHYRPMKTRMFLVKDTPEFVWDYDAIKMKGEGISDWLERWEAAPGKIDLPK